MVSYKAGMAIPIALLLFSAAVLVQGFVQTGEWFERSIDLKGGTVITLKGVSLEQVGPLEGARVREVSGFGGQGVLIELPPEQEPQQVLGQLQSSGVPVQVASIQTVGPLLGQAFWFQAQIAIVVALALMGIVAFAIFRNPVSSGTVIFAAAVDILETLAFMQVFSIPLSLASLAAILMMIGYSVDTEVLLSSRMLRTEGFPRDRFRGALKTGLMMSFTAIGVMAVLFVAGLSPTITEIAAVLLIGLVMDLVNSWLLNAGIFRWHAEGRVA